MQKLNVYYCISVSTEYAEDNTYKEDAEYNAGKETDVQFIEKYMKTFLTVNFNKDIQVYRDCTVYNVVNDDINLIKNGLCTFNEMFKNLKLKSVNETWFIYVSSKFILLNTVPSEKKAFYCIDKTNLDIKKMYKTKIKLDNMVLFKMRFLNIINEKKCIEYDN